jgi:hypothetical protein
MTAAEHVIRWSTASAVVGVAAVAAVASYEHTYALVRAHGEAGWTGRLVPLTVDRLIYASSMVMLDSARRKVPVPALARWLLGLGIAANVMHGLGHGPVGAVVAAWPAVALVGSYEVLMMIIRGSQAAPDGASGSAGIPDPLQEQAADIRRPASSGPRSFGPCHPFSAARRPAPGAAAARVSRCRSYGTG